MRGRLWIVVVLAGALGLGAGAAVRHWTASTANGTTADAQPDAAPAVVGEQRPAFSLPDRNGDTRSIADFGGKVVLLNFWATWCPPCLEEIPALDGLQDQFGDRGLRVLGVALEDREAVQRFAAQHDITYPLLVGARAAFDLAGEYGNARGTIPYSVVIDRTGTVRATHQGALTRKAARALVTPWL